MKLAIASDIHLEFNSVDLISEPADVLILAGDICPAYWATPGTPFISFFKECAGRFRDVIYILGNHEFYGGDLLTTARQIGTNLRDINNLHFLDDDAVEIGGRRFLGSTLWTMADPQEIESLLCQMADYAEIKNDLESLAVADLDASHMKHLAWLTENIATADVVVTHHAPSYKSVKLKFQSSKINSGFANAMDEIIIENPQVKLWVHGHMHDPSDYQIGETRIVCNPRGYFGLEVLSRRFTTKIVEI